MNFIPYFDEIKDFTRLSDCTEKVELALSRLESPVEITEEKVLMYQDYLFKSAPSVVPQFIDLNKISVFPPLVKYRVIRKANILKFTEYAREAKRMDILSYLMDVGYQLKTKPKNLNIAPKFTQGKTVLNSSFVPDYSTVKAGQIIWLGRVAMPWKALENKDGKLLLMSMYVLDCLPFEDFYDPLYFSTSFDRTRWPYCSLRRRINNEFYNSLLADNEKEKVVPVYISAEDALTFEERADAKKDNMFILSKTEAERYLKTEKERIAPVASYALRSMLYNDFENYAYWWLRSQGRYAPEKMYVLDGNITSRNSIVGGDHFNFFGVRPAFYYNYK